IQTGTNKQGHNSYGTVTVLPQLNHLIRGPYCFQMKNDFFRSDMNIPTSVSFVHTNSRSGSDPLTGSDNTGASASYSTGTTLLSPMTAAMVSSGGGLSQTNCGGTILVPLSAGSAPSSVGPLIHCSPASSSHSPPMDNSNAATVNTSTGTITVSGSGGHMGDVVSATGTNVSSSVSYTMSGTDGSTTSGVAGGGDTGPGTDRTTMIGCNGPKDNLDFCESSSHQNGQSMSVDQTVEMKPEPLEARTPLPVSSLDACIGGATLAVSTPTELASIAFNQLPPLLPFMPHPSGTTGQTLVSPVVKLGGARGLGTTTTITLDSSAGELASSSASKSTPGTGPYRCRDCDKEFRILRYLEKHRRIHTGEKPYQCCYCGRQFNDWPNMNRHKRIHTGERPYRCSICTKTFSQPAVYNEHVKRHTGERPYICGVCTKGFPRAARLAVHMRVHTGERPYACTSCERRFSQPHHLAAHLRVHSGDRPYSCPKCDVSFACISNLRRHRKQVHPSSPIPMQDGTDGTEATVVTLDEKKPTLSRITITTPETGGSAVALDSASAAAAAASSLLSSSNLGTGGGGGDAPPVALAAAAAMSGTLLTATGAALVPANLLPNSSGIPSLILTSGPPGATILAAAPAHFSDQHSQLQPALIATSNADSLRQTAVTFITSTGELDRSCTGLTGATLTTAGPEGGLLVNSSSGETVYLEPLDPRVAFEPGQPFTLTTIPTSNHPHGTTTTTILGPSYAGAQILGHPVQLQPGQHGTHIAFTTGLPAHPSQSLGPNTAVFSPNTTVTSSNPGQGTIYTNQSPATIIFPPPSSSTVVSTGSSTQTTLTSSRGGGGSQTNQSVLHVTGSSQTGQSSLTGSIVATPSQLFHYHRPVSNSRTVSPGRPSSTPTQQQLQQQQQLGVSAATTTMLVPILTTLASNSAVSEPGNCDGLPSAVSCSVASLSSAASSSSSLGPITVATSVPDTNL
ncbi:putative Zinc finger protein, partial [Fasciolopsis buskii]